MEDDDDSSEFSSYIWDLPVLSLKSLSYFSKSIDGILFIYIKVFYSFNFTDAYAIDCDLNRSILLS